MQKETVPGLHIAVFYFDIFTLHVAVLPEPSFAFTVMGTVLPFPARFAFTTPFEDTVAYFVLPDLNITDLSYASFGVTFAFSVKLSPGFSV